MAAGRWIRPLLAFALIMISLALGVTGSIMLGKRGRAEVRGSYLRAALSSAAGIEPELVAALRGAPQDAEHPAYRAVRSVLLRIKTANPDCRFAYLMAMKDNQVIFLADAEPPESEDASAPGDVYEDASPELTASFGRAEAFTEGPIPDEWGVWVTGFAPVVDPSDGKVLAMLGLDWDAHRWRWQTNIYLYLGLAITLFPALLLSTLFASYLRMQRINSMLVAETNERQRVQQELELLAQQDSLTQLANRRTFDSRLDLEWRRALRSQSPVSLIMLDVDNFKSYNDIYGHQAGDEALIAVADVMRETVRRAGDETCRYGGEEFAVILPGTGEQGALNVATRICNALAERKIPHSGSKTGPCLTASVGYVSMIPTTDHDASWLVSLADKALYRAKHNGRNRVEALQDEQKSA